MNDIGHGPNELPTTQAADGWPRLKWSLAQFERLIELGILTERDRVELIDGELIPMASKGVRHERVRGKLAFRMTRHAPAGLVVYQEPGWRPGGDRYVEPEILVCPESCNSYDCPPSEALLLVEVSDTSLRYDTGLKAETYARLGDGEYWVVNARTLETIVHRDPAGDGYRDCQTLAAGAALNPRRFAFTAPLVLADLGLG
jgi:Uma2 family endonuclease